MMWVTNAINDADWQHVSGGKVVLNEMAVTAEQVMRLIENLSTEEREKLFPKPPVRNKLSNNLNDARYIIVNNIKFTNSQINRHLETIQCRMAVLIFSQS